MTPVSQVFFGTIQKGVTPFHSFNVTPFLTIGSFGPTVCEAGDPEFIGANCVFIAGFSRVQWGPLVWQILGGSSQDEVSG